MLLRDHHGRKIGRQFHQHFSRGLGAPGGGADEDDLLGGQAGPMDAIGLGALTALAGAGGAATRRMRACAPRCGPCR
jgi:hypothetical protein